MLPDPAPCLVEALNNLLFLSDREALLRKKFASIARQLKALKLYIRLSESALPEALNQVLKARKMALEKKAYKHALAYDLESRRLLQVAGQHPVEPPFVLEEGVIQARFSYRQPVEQLLRQLIREYELNWQPDEFRLSHTRS